MLLCDDCDCGFHMHCLSPILVSYPRGSWFCSKCQQKRDNTSASAFEETTTAFRTNQATILQYFKVALPPAMMPQAGAKRKSNTIANTANADSNADSNANVNANAIDNASSLVALALADDAFGAQKKKKIRRRKRLTMKSSADRRCFRLAVPVKDAMQRLMQLATFASAMKVNSMAYVFVHYFYALCALYALCIVRIVHCSSV